MEIIKNKVTLKYYEANDHPCPKVFISVAKNLVYIVNNLIQLKLNLSSIVGSKMFMSVSAWLLYFSFYLFNTVFEKGKGHERPNKAITHFCLAVFRCTNHSAPLL